MENFRFRWVALETMWMVIFEDNKDQTCYPAEKLFPMVAQGNSG